MTPTCYAQAVGVGGAVCLEKALTAKSATPSRRALLSGPCQDTGEGRASAPLAEWPAG